MLGARSSVDRALPSGGKSVGSTPIGRIKALASVNANFYEQIASLILERINNVAILSLDVASRLIKTICSPLK